MDISFFEVLDCSHTGVFFDRIFNFDSKKILLSESFKSGFEFNVELFLFIFNLSDLVKCFY